MGIEIQFNDLPEGFLGAGHIVWRGFSQHVEIEEIIDQEKQWIQHAHHHGKTADLHGVGLHQPQPGHPGQRSQPLGADEKHMTENRNLPAPGHGKHVEHLIARHPPVIFAFHQKIAQFSPQVGNIGGGDNEAPLGFQDAAQFLQGGELVGDVLDSLLAQHQVRVTVGNRGFLG